jgi:apolipoprotein N-acyltransferase
VPRTRSIALFFADQPRLSRLIFFVLGCVTTLTFAPMGLDLLAPLLMLPFLYVCLIVSPRDAAKKAFWFGFGLFLCGTYWIYISVHVFGKAPLWIALLLMIGLTLIMSFYLWLAAWLTSRLSIGEPWLLLIVAPAVWVLIEWLRGWVLTGFPWLALGYSQIDSPLAGWAPVLGVYGVSLMLMFSSAALIVVYLRRGRQQLLAIVVVLLPWIIGAGLRGVEWTESAGSPVQTTIVQGGVSQDRKWLPEQFQSTLDYYRRETQLAQSSELVIWPEVAIPSVTDLVEDYVALLESDARIAGQTIMFGILERVHERSDEAKVYNSVVMLGSEGGSRSVYRKRHLVPFGEYFPVPASVREWMRMMSLPHNDLTPGAAIQPLPVAANGTAISVAICYEDAYGSEQLYSMEDAGMLVNVSNDAWFGDSIAPHQHLEIARMRALEVGRFAVRATNTGISAFIGPDGKILDAGPQFEPVSMTMGIEPRKGATPYMGWANKPVIGFCLLVLGVFWIRSRVSL